MWKMDSVKYGDMDKSLYTWNTLIFAKFSNRIFEIMFLVNNRTIVN